MFNAISVVVVAKEAINHWDCLGNGIFHMAHLILYSSGLDVTIFGNCMKFYEMVLPERFLFRQLEEIPHGMTK